MCHVAACRGLAAIGSKSRARLQDDEKLVTLQVGKSVFDGAPRNMRTELWMSSLQRKGVGVAAAAKYEDLLLSVSTSRGSFPEARAVLSLCWCGAVPEQGTSFLRDWQWQVCMMQMLCWHLGQLKRHIHTESVITGACGSESVITGVQAAHLRRLHSVPGIVSCAGTLSSLCDMCAEALLWVPACTQRSTCHRCPGMKGFVTHMYCFCF